MTDYVVGFRFDRLLNQVLLIRKIKPEWQAGRLNGVGGKIESNETPKQAMVREFDEETGIITTEDSWTEVCVYIDTSSSSSSYIIYFFKSFGDICTGDSKTLEELVYIHLDEPLPDDIIYNISWLIPLALDSSINFPIIVTE